MQPQFVSYLRSPHARVDCVECHVGSGAAAYVKTKINGMRQLYHLAMNDFPRPITMNSTTLRTPSSPATNAIPVHRRSNGNSAVLPPIFQDA